ncbi:acyltransferase [Catenulispora subtropica]|uniref:Acyltransferase n=1 Tax=Catenulispora subtropica TaxID=450798 RepID=A0ABN2T6K5_9ACTN
MTAPPAGRPARLPALTGMRFFAAALVFFFHAMYQVFFSSAGAQAKYTSVFGRAGYLGVGFFFVLSGFILTWTARDTDTAPRFWRRRVCKIWPNHLITFVVAFILLAKVVHATNNLKYAAANVLLVQAWFPDLNINNGYNSISWSLSCEALFYLLFPVLLVLIRRIPARLLWACALGVTALVFLVPVAAQLLPHQQDVPFAPASEDQFWFIYFFPPVRLLDFVLGIIVARIVISGRRVPLGLGGSLAVAVAAYALAPVVFPAKATLVAVMILPTALVIANAAQTDAQARPTWLSSRVMVWLGEISFAFYLWHFMVLNYGHRALGLTRHWSTPAAFGVIALLLGVTVLLSWLLYSLVENPVMKRFSVARSARRSAAAPPVPEPVPAVARPEMP